MTGRKTSKSYFAISSLHLRSAVRGHRSLRYAFCLPACCLLVPALCAWRIALCAKRVHPIPYTQHPVFYLLPPACPIY